MGVNIICVVERRMPTGEWERAEHHVEASDYELALAEDPLHPPLESGHLVRDSLSIGRNKWLESIHISYGHTRGMPSDASQETVNHLNYWCDGSVGTSWLSLKEILLFQWEFFSRQELSLQEWHQLREHLESIGTSAEVRLIYGWNV